ncbi:MAG: hypothetical protein H0V32_03785 [Nocardioidaceae bacterium]|jgi:uncharacterized integral membrane protein|nr:hypothetical protein [Nocardioidaceae bacterium]MDQ3324381.1 hypothetical protein [Actinomycetota bacterium]
MAVLGIIVVILAAVVAVVLVRQGSDLVTLGLPGVDVDTTVAGVFGIGAACAVLVLLGLALIVGGARRSSRRRKEVKQLRREAGSQPASSSRSSRPDDRTGRDGTRADQRQSTWE